MIGRLIRRTACALLLVAMGMAGTVAGREVEPPFAPALKSDFPDPFVLAAGGGWIAYGTNPGRGKVNVQMAASADLVHWQRVRDPSRKLHDAMPVMPPWAKRGYTWAPEVIRIADDYLLYFTARDRRSGLQCIGAARASDPAGPFTSPATEPLVCQTRLGGSIDPNPFRDADGQLYLYFKNDGNNPDVRKPTGIWVQRLTPDGLALAGDSIELLRNGARWEGEVIEAPTMVRTDTGYRLFYSAGDYGWPSQAPLSPYAIGYAVCAGALGPCTKAADNPILYSRAGKTGCLSGPGHQSIVQSAGRSFIAFHAWSVTPDCTRLDPVRWLYVAPLAWREGRPVIGPALDPAHQNRNLIPAE